MHVSENSWLSRPWTYSLELEKGRKKKKLKRILRLKQHDNITWSLVSVIPNKSGENYPLFHVGLTAGDIDENFVIEPI